MRKIAFLLVLLSGTVACHTTKTEVENTSGEFSLVFGKYHGFCAGDCVSLYKISGEQLFEDDLMRFSGWDTPVFKDTPMSKQRYQQAKVLLDNFSPSLLQTDAETIGCPDCADQGGYYLEWQQGEVLRRWRIDTNENELPNDLVAYTRQITQVLESLH